jgi:polyhydroxyalkanoate synthesis regulator phasin
MSEPNNIPENVLRLIIKEMVKEGFEPYYMESIYEDSSDLDKIESVLKKFGITDTDLHEFGFYAMLLMENYDEKTETINSPLKIPKKFNVNVWFDVDLNKRIVEKCKLPLETYNTDKSFINDMIAAGDMSYHDGEFFDDDVIDTDFIDWNITDVSIERNLTESKKIKKIIKENNNSELIRLRKLKSQIQKRIDKLTS